MKKLLFAIICMCVFTVALQAQTPENVKAEKMLTKQEKELLKQKQNEEMESALKQSGASETQIASFKEIMKTYGAKSNEVRKDAALTEEAKQEKLKAIQEEKNTKLAEIIGADKYKAYNKIRKDQKLAASAQ